MDRLPISIKLEALRWDLDEITHRSGVAYAHIKFEDGDIRNVEIKNLYDVLRNTVNFIGSDAVSSDWLEDTDCEILTTTNTHSEMVTISIKVGEVALYHSDIPGALLKSDLAQLKAYLGK
jgi:hypothetical protein